jgi:hypothetical protein
MPRLIGAAVLALTLMLGGSAAIHPAAAAPDAVEKQHTRQGIDLSARRHIRYAYRPYHRPYYYLDRPYNYAPAPFVPFNFGYGLWPWW